MIGTLRLTAKLHSGSWNAEQSIDVGVTLYERLRLAGVMISYNGPASSATNAPNLTIDGSTLADLQAMAGTALTLFPVESTASFRTAGTLVQTNHLQDTSFRPPAAAPNGTPCTAGSRTRGPPTATRRAASTTGCSRMACRWVPWAAVAVAASAWSGNEPWNWRTPRSRVRAGAMAPSGGAPNPDPASWRTSHTDPPTRPRATTANTAST